MDGLLLVFAASRLRRDYLCLCFVSGSDLRGLG